MLLICLPFPSMPVSPDAADHAQPRSACAGGKMQRPIKSGKTREILRSTFAVLLSTLVTLAVLEVILRVADFRALRAGKSERSLVYPHDAELGWAPVPASDSTVTNARTIHARHNQLGFRDVEFQRDGR